MALRVRAPNVPPASAAASAGGRSLGVVLVVATFLAYAPAWRAEFIWNDSDYVTAPHLRSLAGLGRIWTEIGATEQYYPFLHSAFWLEHQIFGDAPAGYHLLNIALHATSALLLVGLLRRLAIPGAWLAAFLFALHPVYVESVAWISEQKNTLSLVFYLLAARLYLRFEADRSTRTYVLATAIFVVALLTKTVTATLPAALLVALWWRRGALSPRRDVTPLVPWFVLGAAMGLLSAWVEKVYIGAHGAEFALTLGQRALLAGRVVWFYLGKLVWPAELIFIYPRWTIDPARAAHWVGALLVIATLALLWRFRRHSRAPLAAALFFGGSLFPTIGFFNVYAFIFSFVADHWQYLPSLGIVVLAAAGLTRLLTLPRVPAVARHAIPVVLVAGLAGLSFQQSRMYADMRTFYAVTLERNPDAWMAHNNLGNLLFESGDLAGARGHFEAALRVRPDLVKAHNNLGNVLRAQHDFAGAAAQYREALALKPDYAEAHNNLGGLLRQQGRPAEAIPHFLQALQTDPNYHDARNNLGVALRETGRLREALAEFERLVRESPTMAAAHLNLALTLSLVGRQSEAATAYREARRLNPAIPEIAFE